jgi:hypothetical protein
MIRRRMSEYSLPSVNEPGRCALWLQSSSTFLHKEVSSVYWIIDLHLLVYLSSKTKGIPYDILMESEASDRATLYQLLRLCTLLWMIILKNDARVISVYRPWRKKKNMQVSGFRERNLNLVPPEHEAGLPTTGPVFTLHLQ